MSGIGVEVQSAVGLVAEIKAKQKGLEEDIKAIYAEAAQNGLDETSLKEVVRRAQISTTKAPSKVWTDELKARVKELYEKNSATMIVEILANDGIHLTRNAIMGAVFRMGLAKPVIRRERPLPRLKPVNKPRLHIVRANSNSNALSVIESVETGPIKLRCVEIVPRHVSLVDLEADDCRYPYGGEKAGDPFTFCGHPKQSSSPWCEAHHRLCTYRAIVLSEQEQERRRRQAHMMRRALA